MNLSDYISSLANPEERSKTRLIHISRSEETNLRQGYANTGSGIKVLHVSEFVTCNGFIPMPSRLFATLEPVFRDASASGLVPYLVGLDGYLSLFSPEDVREAFDLIKGYLDGTGNDNNTVIFILNHRWNECDSVLSNPRYRENGYSLFFDDASLPLGVTNTSLALVDGSFVSKSDEAIPSLSEYLQRIEQGLLIDRELAKVSFNGHYPFPQISRDIRQLCTLHLWFRYRYGEEWNLSDDAFLWIHQKIPSFNGYESLRLHYFPDGIKNLAVEGVKRLYDTQSECDFEVLSFLLRHELSAKSYLAWVLSQTDLKREAFLGTYICKVCDDLSSPEANAWSEERKEAIKPLLSVAAPHISRLIDLLKGKDVAFLEKWLNFDLNEIRVEFVRRALLCNDYLSEEMRIIRRAYPLIDDYFTKCPTEHREIDSYFEAYRKEKWNNAVTDAFTQKAFEASTGSLGIDSRNSLMQKHHKDSVTVLVVDAMGGEYLPMVVALAKKMNIGIVKATFASADLPSSTKFNSVSQTTDKINGLDGICHNGMGCHEKVTDEENLVGELEYVGKNVISKVASLLNSSDSVILTADHGTSRLAVLAYKQGLSKTIEAFDGINPISWRIAEIKKSSSAIHNDFVLGDLSNTHLSVKGYNRFSFSGAPVFEIHGGATIEERVVPFIVFEKGVGYTPPAPSATDTEKQFESDADFDDL